MFKENHRWIREYLQFKKFLHESKRFSWYKVFESFWQIFWEYALILFSKYLRIIFGY